MQALPVEGQMSYWTDADSLPLTPGVYRIRLGYAPYCAWARWDGDRWCAWSSDRGRASLEPFRGPRRVYQWRVG